MGTFEEVNSPSAEEVCDPELVGTKVDLTKVEDPVVTEVSGLLELAGGI